MGTPLFASLEGKVLVKNDYLKGYGLHIRIRCHDKEVLLAHLSRVTVKTGDWVRQFSPIAFSGGGLDHPYRGNSEGPHLHFGLRRIETDPKITDIFKQKVVNYDNGYFGYVDPFDDMVWWKGGGDRLQLS
jgi:murein DD-endopeptidase MepM/ murein hydrolase activator NlpD